MTERAEYIGGGSSPLPRNQMGEIPPLRNRAPPGGAMADGRFADQLVSKRR